MTILLRRLFSTAACGAVLAVLSACGSSTTAITSPSSLSRCGVTVDGTGSIPAQGGSGTLTVAAARECAWSARAEAAWLSIRSGAQGQGNGAVEFAAVPNPDPAVRRGAVVLNDQRVDVTQAAGECVFSFGGGTAAFAQGGGEGRIEVRASSTLCSWKAESDVPWIVVRADGSGRGSAPVVFDVQPLVGPARSGTVAVGGQRFEISQSLTTGACQYSISPPSVTAGPSGSSGSIAVTTAPGCAWTASSEVPWLALQQGSGTGPGTVPFTIEATSGGGRTGSAVIAGQRFAVSQTSDSGPACTFSVAPQTHDIGPAGGTVTVNVTVSAACAWNSSSAVPWAQLDGPTLSVGPGRATFTVPATTSARTGTVTVADQPITINQAGPSPCSFSISPESGSVPAAGGGGRVAVTAGASCAWTAVSNDGWIQIPAGASGAGNGEVQFVAAAQPGGAPRTGTLTIAGRTFTLTQSAACTAVIAPEARTVDAAGGRFDVAVQASGGCPWTAVSQAPWIAVRDAGNGSVEVTVAGNPGAARTGTALIAGRTLTVTQPAVVNACQYEVDPIDRDLPPGDRVMRLDVRAAGQCGWTAVSNVPWITVTWGAAGSGDGEVWLYVSANSGGDRTGTLTVAGQTVTIEQRGNGGRGGGGGRGSQPTSMSSPSKTSMPFGSPRFQGRSSGIP